MVSGGALVVSHSAMVTSRQQGASHSPLVISELLRFGLDAQLPSGGTAAGVTFPPPGLCQGGGSRPLSATGCDSWNAGNRRRGGIGFFFWEKLTMVPW